MNGRRLLSSCPKRRGVTLVELLVSSLILSLGFIAVAQLFLASMWTYEKSRDTSTATQRAQYELERASNLKYEGLTASDLSSVYPSSIYTINADKTISFTVPDLPGSDGKITLTKDPYGAGGNAAGKLLGFVVEINWRKNQGYSKGGIKVETLLSRGM